MKKFVLFIGLLCIWLGMNAVLAIFYPGYLFITDWFRWDMIVLLLIAVVPLFMEKYIFSYTYMTFLCIGFLVECILSNYYRELLGHSVTVGMRWNLALIIIGFVVGIFLQIMYSRRQKRKM